MISEVYLRLRQQGYGFACATCKHMQNQFMNGREGCFRECYGPLKGKAFPQRDSEIPLHTVCFVCGEQPSGCVSVEGKYIGVCEKHIHVLETYSAGADKPAFVRKVSIALE